ncbi:metallophosphoesterase family protein [Verrucomicrobiales bacterium]|nr:metallophosphoesterase family protein [Verrucomicrobiales bacterium]
MRFIRPLVTFSLLATTALIAEVGDVHGPICSWHLDPTSTMTIQWVEKSDAPVPSKRWWSAKAGFGYGDDDDTTILDMEGKFARLYLRKEFNVKDVPKVAQMNPAGKWSAKTKIGEEDYEFRADLTFKDDKLSGTITQKGGDPKELKSGYVSGNRIHFVADLTVVAAPLTVNVSATLKDKKLEGDWKATDADGKELAKNSLVMERIISEEEKKVEDAKSDEQKKKEEEERKKNQKQVLEVDKFVMQLRIKYDDAFIAYLNGEEIHRVGIKEGRGRDAKEIAQHDADKEEVFEIDKKFNRLLKEGKNLLAIEGHNRGLDSSDFTLDPKFWVKVDKKEHKFIDGGQDWDFFLGDPADNWATAEIKSKPLPALAENVPAHVLHYGERGQALDRKATAERLAFADTFNIVHRVVLTGLRPDRGYAFEIYRPGESRRLKNRKFLFKTAPATRGESLTFVTGGDMFHKRNLLDDMNRQASDHDPLFALLGGDLAYADGKKAEKWYDWLDSWNDWCETTDDYMIPMVLAIGNHECSEEIKNVKEEERAKFRPEENAKFFYSLFPLPEGKSNYALDFGNYMSIVCLDSCHTQMPKDQVEWLDKALSERQNVPNLYACYHKPTYGSLVKDDDMEVRKHFVPLFDKYGVDVAFENDHHVYKRTLPLKGDVIHPDGTIYMGDGSWGVDLRDIPWDKATKLDYLVRAAKANNLIRVRLSEGQQRYDAFNAKGEPLDGIIRFTK